VGRSVVTLAERDTKVKTRDGSKKRYRNEPELTTDFKD